MRSMRVLDALDSTLLVFLLLMNCFLVVGDVLLLAVAMDFLAASFRFSF